MATKLICDNCGGDGAGRAVVNVSRTTPLEMPPDFPKLDVDLCQMCFEGLLRSLRPILMPNAKLL